MKVTATLSPAISRLTEAARLAAVAAKRRSAEAKLALAKSKKTLSRLGERSVAGVRQIAASSNKKMTERTRSTNVRLAAAESR